MNTVIRTIADIYRRNHYLDPDGLALVFEDQRVSNASLYGQAARLASGLMGIGASKGDRISLLAMNRPEFCEYYAAVAIGGFIGAPLNFRLTVPEMVQVLRDAAPSVLIFESQYAEAVEAIRQQVDIDHYICLDDPQSWSLSYESVLASGDENLPIKAPSPDDPYLLLYTSGTTGRPKGVVMTHRAEVCHCETMISILELTGRSKVLVMMPWFHAGAHSQSIAAFYRGCTIVMHRRYDPVAILETIQAERVSHMHLAPTLLRGVVDVPEIKQFDRSSIQTILYSAAPMPVPLLKRGLELFGRVFVNGYGLTELTATVLEKGQHHLDGSPEQVKRLGSVGQATRNTALKICDDNGAEVPQGDIGEIWAKTDTMLSAYWNNSVTTLESIRDGWLKTGDMGYLDPQGYLFLVDRRKDMIITGGENVYCREVEEAVISHPSVADVAVIGTSDAKWGELVTAIVVLKPNLQADDREIIAHARKTIAGYKCPKKVIYVSELPRLPSGKVNKVALRDRYRTLEDADAT